MECVVPTASTMVAAIFLIASGDLDSAELVIGLIEFNKYIQKHHCEFSDQFNFRLWGDFEPFQSTYPHYLRFKTQLEKNQPL